MTEKRKRKPLSESHRASLSAAAKRVWSDPDYHRHQVKVHKEFWASHDTQPEPTTTITPLRRDANGRLIT